MELRYLNKALKKSLARLVPRPVRLSVERGEDDAVTVRVYFAPEPLSGDSWVYCQELDGFDMRALRAGTMAVFITRCLEDERAVRHIRR
jgi:hypothetical protein